MLISNFFSQYRFFPVKYPGRIRTSCHTKTTTNTTITINQYNAILSFKSCIDRTHFYAGWLIAMHTGSGFPIWSSMIGILHFKHLYPILPWMHLVHMIASTLTSSYIFAPGKINNHHKFFPWNSFPCFTIRYRWKIGNGF